MEPIAKILLSYGIDHKVLYGVAAGMALGMLARAFEYWVTRS